MADDTATNDAATTDAAADEAAEAVEAVQPDELRDGIVSRLGDVLGEALLESVVAPGVDLTVRVRTDAWRAAADAARNHLGAKYFCFLSVIDWLPSPYGRSMDADVDKVLAARAGDVADAPSVELGSGVAGGDTRFQAFARVAHVGGAGEYWGMTLKADIGDDTTIDSWVPVFAGADWHEREAWEMFGITFTDHPGLRHMYLPGDFQGNPMRKDYPLISRMVKPWPGIVDVEPMPSDDSDAAGGDASGDAAGESDA